MSLSFLYIISRDTDSLKALKLDFHKGENPNCGCYSWIFILYHIYPGVSESLLYYEKTAERERKGPLSKFITRLSVIATCSLRLAIWGVYAILGMQPWVSHINCPWSVAVSLKYIPSHTSADVPNASPLEIKKKERKKSKTVFLTVYLVVLSYLIKFRAFPRENKDSHQ